MLVEVLRDERSTPDVGPREGGEEVVGRHVRVGEGRRVLFWCTRATKTKEGRGRRRRGGGGGAGGRGCAPGSLDVRVGKGRRVLLLCIHATKKRDTENQTRAGGVRRGTRVRACGSLDVYA